LQAFQWSHGWEREISLQLLQDAVGLQAATELLNMDRRTSHDTPQTPLPENCHIIKSLSGNVWVTAGSPNGSYAASFQADFPAYGEYQNRYYLNSMRWMVPSGTGDEPHSNTVRGMSEPGILLVLSGQTERVSWGLAVADVDTEDLYYEEFREVNSNFTSTSTGTGGDGGEGGDGGDGGGLVCGEGATPCTEIEIKSNGHWRQVQTRIEQITVAPTTIKEKSGPYNVPHLVVTTSHGPVIGNLTVSRIAVSSVASTNINEFSKNSIKLYANASLCSQALRQPSDMAWLLHLASAENAVDFANAADSYKVASMHLLFASTDEIGHVVTGAPVRRVDKHLGNVPVSGSTGDFDWLQDEGEEGEEGEGEKERGGEGVISDATSTAIHLKTKTNTGLFTSKTGAIIALEEKIASNDHNLNVIYKWVNEPDKVWERLFLGYDTLSSTSLVLAQLVLSAPSLSANIISLESDTETRRKLSQLTTILQNFDGKYDENAIAPALLEAILEDLSSSLLGDRSKLVGLLRGAPFAPLYRDAGQAKLLGNRRWMLSMLSQLNSTLAFTTGTPGGTGTWSLPLKNLDSLVRTAALNAQSWAENELGINKNYKNTHWNWASVHRATGKHPAAYHTIVNSIMSMPALPCRGTTDTLQATPTGYDADSTPYGNLMQQMQDTSSFYLRGHQLAVRFFAMHGGLNRNNETQATGFMAGIATGQSEHRGSPWGNRKRSVNIYGSLITPVTVTPVASSIHAAPVSDMHVSTDVKEGL